MDKLLANSLENKINFVPIRDAAKRVSYTTDYVARLAREGKIIARRDGRVWQVDLESLKLFSLRAKAEAIRKQEALKVERKRERAAVVTKKISLQSDSKINDWTLPRVATLQAVAIILCLTLTISIFETILRTNVLASITSDVFTVVVPQQQAVTANVWQANFWPQWLWLWKVETHSVVADAANSQPLVLEETKPLTPLPTAMPPQIASGSAPTILLTAEEGDIDSVGQHFSDVVDVQFVDARQGTITATFSSEVQEPYPFVIVDAPVVLSTENDI